MRLGGIVVEIILPDNSTLQAVKANVVQKQSVSLCHLLIFTSKNKAMNLPNLDETVETVSNWIKSCKDESQLNLCKDVIQTFVVDRFKNHVTPVSLAISQNRLETLIETRKTEIIGYGLEVLNLKN